MFEKVTSEELAPIDYEERQALLNEIAQEDAEEAEEAEAPEAPEAPFIEIPF